MIFEKGDIWSIYKKTSVIFITANSFVKIDGRLVMGRGLALEAKNKFSNLDFALGERIKRYHPPRKYGLVMVPHKVQPMGAFQVKHHFKDDAEVELIEYSTLMLKDLANCFPDKRFDMNFPGIGWGRLSKETVIPIIKTLPDNVHIWEYAEEDNIEDEPPKE